MQITRTILLLFALSGIFLPNGFAQNASNQEYLDSLRLELSKTPADTNRLNIYFDLLINNVTSDTLEIDKIAVEAIAFAKKIEARFPNSTHRIRCQIAVVYAQKGMSKKSNDWLLKILEDPNVKPGHSMYRRVYHYLGDNHKQLGKIEKALEALGIAFEEAKRKKELIRMADIKGNISTIQRNKGEIDQAILSLNECLQILEPVKDKSHKALVYNSLGRIYRGKSEYDSARYYYTKNLDLSLALKNKRNISVSYNNLGNIYQSEGNLEKALESYVNSLKIKEELGNKKSIAIAYHNIASVRIDLEDYSRALKDLEKSKELGEAVDFKLLEVHNFQKIGNIFRIQNKLEEAIDQHQTALKLATDIKFKAGQMESMLNLGKDFMIINKFNLSLDFYLRSLEYAEAIGRKRNISLALIGIAEMYMQYDGVEKSNNQLVSFKGVSPAEIEKLLVRGNNIAQEIGDLANTTTALKALRTFYQKQNNYKKEAETSRKYIVFKDSLFNQQKAKAVADWETKYETTEKEKEIQLLQKEKALQKIQTAINRNIYIGVFIFLFLLAGLGLMYFYYKNKISRAKQMETMRTKISSDLHDDVGSILSGLAMQTEVLALTAKESDKPKLNRLGAMSRTAMSQMRDMVWAIDSRKDKFENLVDRIREFAEETLAVKDIDYKLNIDNIDTQKIILADVRQNIYLICKEAISNILKHSMANQVTINMKNEGSSFLLLIKDNGQVIRKDYKTTGQGTSNMRMRAERINGTLEFQTNNGFTVLFKMKNI